MIYIIKYLNIFFLLLFLKFLNYLTYTHLILIYFLYCFYVKLTNKTKLYYTKTDKNNKILSLCPDISKPNFKPHFLIPFAFQQNIICSSKYIISDKSSYNLEFREDKINTYGLTLYWPYFKNSKEPENNNSPILMILPGMTGDITDPYILNISTESLKNGYHVCVYQMRSLSENFGVDESQKFTYKNDIDITLDHIKQNKKYGKAKIFAIGYSFGANNLLYYLGDINSKFSKENKKICAGISISNPYDMKLCERLCENNIISPLVSMLERKNTKKIINSMKNCKNIKNYDFEKLLNCDNVKEFDEIFSAKFHGLQTADEYYKYISACERMKLIDVPVLCINSNDDPITPKQAIAYDEVKTNSNIFLIVTDRGSHMSFISNEKFTQFKQWHLKLMFQFFNAVNTLNK